MQVGLILEVLAWWGLTAGVWDLTLAGTTLPDMMAAVGAGFLAALAAAGARRIVGGSWVPSPRWLRWLPVLVASVLADAGRVFALALRHVVHREVEGDIQRLDLEPPTLGTAEAHRGFATIVLSSTPGTFTIDTDEDRHALVVHSLVDGPPNLDEVVRR